MLSLQPPRHISTLPEAADFVPCNMSSAIRSTAVAMPI
jgi:hypothetical protein